MLRITMQAVKGESAWGWSELQCLAALRTVLASCRLPAAQQVATAAFDDSWIAIFELTDWTIKTATFGYGKTMFAKAPPPFHCMTVVFDWLDDVYP